MWIQASTWRLEHSSRSAEGLLKGQNIAAMSLLLLPVIYENVMYEMKK